MPTRIYVVETLVGKDASTPRLVEASSQAAAIRYCARSYYDAKAANPKDIAKLMSQGVKVEQATESSDEH